MIKKFLIFIFLFHTFLFISKAQSNFSPEWNVGIGVGPTFSSLSFQQPNPRTKNYTQFHGGLAIRYISEKNVGVIAELNYIQEGWKGEYRDLPQYEHSHSLSYLELPVMTHIYFGNKVRYFINLGPKIQYLISEKEHINDALANAIANNSNDLSTTLQYNRATENKFDYGIIAGTGIEFRTPVGSFSLEGRYYFGLGDIYSNNKSNDNFSRSANRVISVKLTYYTKLF